jgi:[NiFe] hydrogenase assembly HybE family chaperone
MSENALLRPDPSPELERAFERVRAEKMQGLPFVNPALRVEAVAFAPWRSYWLGVMLTPWSMNLMLAPRDPAAWRPLPAGDKRRYSFPAGQFDFISARSDDIGDYLVCSLLSPVLEFADHETARETARLAREALFDSAHAESAEAGTVSTPSPAAKDAEAPSALADLKESLARPITRRELLRGHFLGGSDGSGR